MQHNPVFMDNFLIFLWHFSSKYPNVIPKAIQIKKKKLSCHCNVVFNKNLALEDYAKNPINNFCIYVICICERPTAPLRFPIS